MTNKQEMIKTYYKIKPNKNKDTLQWIPLCPVSKVSALFGWGDPTEKPRNTEFLQEKSAIPTESQEVHLDQTAIAPLVVGNPLHGSRGVVESPNLPLGPWKHQWKVAFPPKKSSFPNIIFFSGQDQFLIAKVIIQLYNRYICIHVSHLSRRQGTGRPPTSRKRPAAV